MGKRKSQAASGSAPERMSADDFMALVDTKKREYKAGASGSTNMSADSFMALVEAKKRQLAAGTVQSAPGYRRKSGTSLPSSQASRTKAMLDSSPDGGYGNYDATYSPARQGLSESSARYLRQQHYQQDKADYDAAQKRYQEAQERASALKDERRLAEARARLGDGKYSDSYFTDLAKREREAREAVGSAEDAMLPYKNRVDAYDATWGKVDKYADTVEKAKGTKGSYSGPSFEDMAAWEKQRSEDAMDQQMAAFRDAAYEDPENGPKVEDRLGFWLNLTEDQKQQETAVSGNAKHWGNLTKDEISAYYYLRQNQGQEAADQYLEDMENELSRREDAKFVKKVENAEGAELVGLNAASVAGNVLGGVPAAVDKAVGAVTGKQNPYSSGQMWQRYAGYVRGYTGQKVSDWAENGLKGVAGQELAERAGNLAKQTYQAVMSGVDSAAGALVFGRGVGIPAGPFTMHAGGYTTVMGLGAAAQRAQELQLQGATDTQIALGSIGSGILEALFEDVSAEAFFENILENPATTAKEFAKKLATQMGVEASEEVCTEIGNLIWDSAVRGKNSDHQQAEREYMEQGMSRQDAKTQAALDSAMDIFWAGYGGLISAGASSVVGQAFAGGQQAIEKARSNYEFGNYMAQNGGNVLDLAEQAETLTDEKAGRKLSKQAEKLAMELRDKEEPGVRGKYRMGKIAGDIAAQAQKESSEADVAAFREVAKNYLKDQENIKSPKRAEKLLVKAYTGEYMTRAEQVYFNSIGGKDLFTKVVDSTPYGSIQEAAETKQSKAWDTVMGLVDSAARETTINDVAAQYGKQAGAVERVYNMADTGSVTPENFGESFDAVYQKGAMGLPITEALKSTGVLTRNQAEMAYRIGTDAAGSYKSSDSGQAYITESREPVVVSSVESISEDGLTLKMDDGQTVNAKNVTFGSPEESMVYTTVGEVFQKAEDANRALTAWQNTGVSGTAFASALRDGYQKGRSGVDFARIRPKTEAGKLTQEIRKMAWEAGKASQDADTAKKETKLKSGTHKKAEAGLKVDQSVKDLNSYSRQQKTTLDLAKVLSKTGFPIEVFASTEEQRKSGVENGSFNTEDGSIRIDLNAGLNGEGLAAYALAHEVTHFAREFSPAKYQIFAETLIEAVNKSETSFEAMLDLKAAELSKLEAYQNLSETKLYDVAQDEVVAEMCETIFTNTDAAQRLSQRLYAKDQSLWGKFKSFMSDLVGRLKEAYAGLNPDSPIARRMKETVTQSENVLNAWVEAVAGAVENFNLQDGQKNDASVEVLKSSRSSDGRTLSDGQRKYFEHSEIRDDDGNLRVVYHGTDTEFTVFDRKRLGTGTDGNASSMGMAATAHIGFWFNSEDIANLSGSAFYDRSMAGYLNITNPLYCSSMSDLEQMIYDHNEGAVNEEDIEWGDQSEFAGVLANQFRGWMEENGYDGIVVRNDEEFGGESYVALYENQFKNADNLNPTSNPDIRFSSRTQQDTEYMNLAKEPEKNRATLQKMVDQAAKDAGYTRLFYHGSKKGGGFTVFKDWQYFTENRDYASRYAERGNDKSLYTTYVRMENPFDTRIDSVRDIFEDARMEYGMGELQENGLPDWTDGYDIADCIDENDLPYDSIVLDEGGDMVNGKPVSRGLSYVVRKSSQVKSADAVTYDDSGNVIPLSQRFNTDADDIRYSRRGESAQQRLDRQQAEIDRLKELLTLQKYGNKNFTLDRNSVEKAASALLKSANAGGSKAELISLLDSFYRYLGTSGDLTWESVSKEAQKAVNFLVENRKTERDPYNQEVLDWMKGRHVALSQEQISEAEYLYGSLKEFRKALGGAVVLDQKANTTLDQFWQEAAKQYADKFSADTTDGDMPGTLAELVDSLRNGESLNTQEARYYEQEIRRDLTRQVYDSYWDVKPVQSVRDDMQKKLDLLKVEHRQAMEAAKAAARSEREKGQKALEDYRKQRDVVETTMMAAYAKQQAQVEQAYQQEMAELRKTYGTDTAAYQDEFFAAMKNKDFQNAHATTLRKMLNELAKDNSGGNKDAEAARKQVYGNLLEQYELELANSGLEDTVKQQREDSGIWEREFKRIAKECEKRGGTIEDLRTELKERVEELQNNWDEEAKALDISYQYDLDAEKANTAIVEKEFARLLRIYEAARQSIQRLEGKVKQQREAAQEKVESRRRTELRKKISDKAKVFQKMALAPAKSNTAHAPVSLMGALSDFCTIFYESEARAVQKKQSELSIRETVNRSKLGIEQVSRALDQDARKRLSEIGGVYNVEGTAKAIVKQLTFEKLNREEKALVSGKAAQQVLSELQSRAERYLGDVQEDSSPALKKESEIIARKKELLGKRAEALQKLQKAYGDLRKDSVLEIFHDDHVQKLVDSLSGMLAESDISGMNAEQLEDVYNVMKAMEYTITNANKVFSAGKNKTLIGMTNKLSKEIKAVTVKHSPALNSIRKYWMWQMSPDTFFNSICGYAKGNEGKAIQQMFVTGMERMMGTQREFYQMFRPLTEATDKATAKAVRELMSKPLKGMVSWGLKNVDGQEVKTSKGMMLQAYMLLNQEDSFNSILYGGFKIPRMEEYYGGNRSDAYSNAETNQLLSAAIGESYMDLVHDIQEARQQGDQAQADALQTKAEEMTRGAVANLIAIRDQLSATIQADPTMSALVDTAAQWYKRSGELLAEVYEGMYGYKPNLVDGYTPIHRDLTTVKTDIREDSSAAFNLENIGLTKERVKSVAPIKLTDFFQELSDHTQQISRFYGFAQVQKDFNRIWNLKMPGSRSTVNTLVADKYGAGKSLFGVSGEEYINNYIKSVAGSSGGGSVLERFYGSAASATLSLNPRVAFSQLASIPTAAAEVGWGSMARGFAKGFTVGLSGQKKSILANDSIWFWQRYRGAGGSTEFSDLAYKGNLWSRISGSNAGKALFNWCQSFDVFATSSMWAMAEDAVQHQQGLTPGTEGYQAAVEQKYSDIIRKSQPNYTVTERSDLLRDKRAGMKLLTMYKTQSNQNLNILMNAWGEYKATMEGIKAGDGLYTQADKAAAGRKLANGITSVTIGGTLAFVLLRTAVNLIMGNLKYYRDDETDEMTGEGLVSGMVGEVLSSTAGMFALGGQLEEILYSAITGGRYYGISDSGISVIATAAEDGQKVLSTIFNREMEDGQKWQYLKKYSANLFYSAMTACGVPAKNAKTMLDAVGTWYTALTKGIPAAMESGETTATQYRARILRGWQEGDMGKIKDTLAILAANSEEDTDEKVLKDVTSGVAQYLKKVFMKNQISGEEAQKLLAYIGHESPEETVQNWVFKKMYPDSDLSNAGIAKWNSYQDIPLDVFESAYKYKGEHGKKAEIVAYIRGLNISASMKKRLWEALKGNWTNKDTPWN